VVNGLGERRDGRHSEAYSSGNMVFATSVQRVGRVKHSAWEHPNGYHNLVSSFPLTHILKRFTSQIVTLDPSKDGDTLSRQRLR
jgi:hypothetical protein